MKTQIFSLVIAAILMACSSAPDSSTAEGNRTGNANTQGNEMNRADNNEPGFSGIEGNEWKLIEVYIDGRDTRFNRGTLPEELKNFFTLNLDGENVSGVGAPNRYSAPYTTSDNKINILLIRSTMMATFFQPENITEYDFFNYMQNAYEWKQVNNNLELLSKTRNGADVRLVFTL